MVRGGDGFSFKRKYRMASRPQIRFISPLFTPSASGHPTTVITANMCIVYLTVSIYNSALRRLEERKSFAIL